MKSRTFNTARNVAWGYVGNILSMLINFITRTVFIYTIGTVYLGINGLFTNVLGVLSFTELGIGTAMNFSLYKPVADGNLEKIKSLMRVYKEAYRVIALIVTLLGLLLLPFLPYIIKGTEGIDNLSLYYLIFLFNTVTSYFVTYKYGLVNAEQKGYILTNIDFVGRLGIGIAQIAALLVYKNFLFYLLAQLIISLLQKVFTSFYINKQYPYLLEKTVQPLDEDEKKRLKTNIKALIIHKLGEISVYQTDNIIISVFLNVGIVGFVSNYNLVLTAATAFLSIAFNSVTASLGNLIATESRERQLEILQVYQFVGFWLYGFATIGFFVLFQPFITLWIGEKNLIDSFSLALILIDNYLKGERIVVNNFKMAGGIFDQDKFIALIQAIVNLIVSVIAVKFIGLPGVYIGTLVQGFISSIWKPIIVYQSLFHQKATSFFKNSLKYGTYTGALIVVLSALKPLISPENSIGSFLIMFFIVTVVSNVVFLLAFWRSPQFQFLWAKIRIVLSHKNR